MGKKRLRKKHHDWHHRKPSSLGKPECCGVDDDQNLSHVSTTKHRAWHTLFSNMPADAVVAELNKTWLDPDYEVELKLRR